MILAILYGLIVAVCIFTKKGKISGFFLLMLLFVLFGFSYGNADYDNYLYKYNNADSLSGSFEILYLWSLRLFNHLGLNYRQYLLLIAAGYIFVVYKISRKFTVNWTWTLALYAIFPFAMDVVQVRNTIALMIVYFAVYKLLSTEKISLRGGIQYATLILIASLFHTMAIVFIAILLAVCLDKRKLVLITALSIGIVVVVPGFVYTVLNWIATRYNVGNRFLFYVKSAGLNFDDSNLRKFLIVLAFFIFMKIGQYIVQNYRIERRYSDNFLLIVEKINIVMLVILPLTLIVPDFYRATNEVALLNYIAWGRAIVGNNGFTQSKRGLLISFYAVVTAGINLYFLVLSSVIIDTVWYPLFFNNTLFSW